MFLVLTFFLCCMFDSAIKIPRDKVFAWMNAVGMVVTALPVTINHLHRYLQNNFNSHENTFNVF